MFIYSINNNHIAVTSACIDSILSVSFLCYALYLTNLFTFVSYIQTNTFHTIFSCNCVNTCTMHVLKQFINHICISCVCIYLHLYVYVENTQYIWRSYTKYPQYVFYVEYYCTLIYVHIYESSDIGTTWAKSPSSPYHLNKPVHLLKFFDIHRYEALKLEDLILPQHKHHFLIAHCIAQLFTYNIIQKHL